MEMESILKRKILIIIEFLFFLIEALSVMFLYKNQIVLLTLLSISSIIYLLILKNYKYLLVFVLAMIIGPIAEIGAILNGGWYYTQTSFLIIPLWLPFAWGIVILFISRLCDFIYLLFTQNDVVN